MPVTTAVVLTKDVPLEINAIGGAEASVIAFAVRAQITGALTTVNFKEGDDVTKGQVLFSFDRRPLEAWRCSRRKPTSIGTSLRRKTRR